MPRIPLTPASLLRILLTFATICLGTPARAPAADTPRDLDDAITRFRTFAATQMALDGMPGMSIGFMLGDVTWSDGFGYADLENQVPATSETMYRLASVTKPMTAMGVLHLVEQEKIDLDAEVRTYVPYFPEKRWTVTPRLLLGHLGGISHYRNYDVEGHFKDHMNTREAIAVFADFDLVAEPGTHYQYSSYGYNLLGAVIEGASGTPYGEYMRREIWDPMRMPTIRMDDPSAIIPHRARGYRRGPHGDVVNSEFVDISSRFAAGGTRASVVDLLAFARGLIDGKVLSPETYDLMWTSMETADGVATDYGMGWGIYPVNGRFRVSHGGSQAETQTYIAVLPTDAFAIALACNDEDTDWQPYFEQLYRLVMGEAWSQRVYLADADDRELYRVVDLAFDSGVAYWDRYGRAVTTDADAVADAFAALQAVADGEDQGIDEALRRGSEHNPAAILGSYLASALSTAIGPSYAERVHRRGASGLFADYAALAHEGDIDPRYVLSASLGERVTRWSTDWDRVWTNDIRLLRVSHEDDPSATVDHLRAAFDGASIYPDLSEQLTDIAERRFRNGDLAHAREATESAIALYPRAQLARVYEGVLDLATGDRDAARARFGEASALSTTGPAGPDGLNALAYEMKAAGQTALGFGILELALELYPDVANLYDSAGEFQLALGERERAIGLYEKAVEVDPEFQHAREMLKELRSDE